MHRPLLVGFASLALLGLMTSCKDKQASQPAAPSSVAPAVSSPAAVVSAAPSASASAPSTSPDSDPMNGTFTLAQATDGLSGKGKLYADLDTSAGKITCELFEDKAPITVANFVGLSRGLRPWRDPATHQWVKKPAYDGLTFHRVIGRFMIQGGDPKGDGTGDGGYEFPDEIWTGATHDRAGQLCMANHGPGTNGMQFFITDAAAKHLDARGHTIFGQCTPAAAVHKIAMVATDKRDRPTTPQVIKKVTIRRGK